MGFHKGIMDGTPALSASILSIGDLGEMKGNTSVRVHHVWGGGVMAIDLVRCGTISYGHLMAAF